MSISTILRFRDDVSLRIAGEVVHVRCDGLNFDATLIDMGSISLAIQLLGGAETNGLVATLDSSAASTLESLRAAKVVTEHLTWDELDLAAAFPKEAHQAGWTGAFRLLSGTTTRAAAFHVPRLDVALRPEIPARASRTSADIQTLISGISCALPNDSKWSALLIDLRRDLIQEFVRIGAESANSLEECETPFPCSSMQSWAPVIFRSGLNVSTLVVLVSSCSPKDEAAYAHMFLVGGIITRNLEAVADKLGLGYLAHYWADPSMLSSMVGDGTEAIVSLVGLETSCNR